MALPAVGVQFVAENLAGYLRDLNTGGNAVARFGSTAQKATSGVSAFAQISIGALRQLGEVAVEAALKAADAVKTFVADSIGAAGDFESGMNEFGAVAGGALQEAGLSIDSFRNQFIALGRELPVSTSDVQQAAIEMVKGGIDPATVAAGGLRQTLQFAAAGGLELAQAAEIAAKAVGGWTGPFDSAAQKAEFLSHSTDLIARAANASTVDVHELALGLYNSQGAAKAAGVSFDDTVTVLAEVSSGFNSSAEAGTAFKNFLIRLQPKTKPAVQAMRDLGLFTDEAGSAFYDAKGNFVGAEKASALLAQSIKGLTKAQQISALETIFGSDALGIATALAERGAEGFRAMADAMAQQSNVTDMAAQKQQGYNTALENAKGSLEALQITVGTRLLPVLTALLNNHIAPTINAITTFADRFFNASDPVLFLAQSLGSISQPLQSIALYLVGAARGGDEFRAWLSAVPAGIQPVVQGLGDVIGWLRDVLPQALAFVTEHADTFKAALLAIGVVLAGGLGIAAIGGLIATLTNPITLVLAAVGALGAAWQSDFLGIRTSLTAFWDQTAAPALSQLGTWLQTNIPIAIQTVSTFFTETLLPAGQNVATFITGTLIPSAVNIADTFGTVLGPAVSTLSDLWSQTLFPALQDLGAFINDPLLPFIKSLADVGIEVVRIASEGWANIWNTKLKPALDTVWGFISANLGPVLKSLGDQLIPKVTSTVESFKKGLDQLIAPIKGAIKWLNDLATTLSNIHIPPGLTPGSPTPFELGIRGIASALGTLVSGPLPAFAAALGQARASADTFMQALRPIGQEGMDQFASGLQSGAGEVRQSVADPVSGAIGRAKEGTNAFRDIGSAIVDGMRKGAEGRAQALAAAMRRISKQALDAAKTALGVSSPSTVFADEVGVFIPPGLAQGIFAALPTALEAARALGTGVKDEALRAVEGIKEGIQGIINEALSGIAGLARSKASGIRAIRDLFPDRSQLDALTAEERSLRVTAQFNLDPGKRQEAAARLLQIEQERAKLQQQIADRQRIAEQAQKELVAAQLKADEIAKTDPAAAAEFYKLRQSQVLELAKLEQEKLNAKTDQEKAAIDAQIKLIKEAQAAETQQFLIEMQKRAAEYKKKFGIDPTGNATADGIIAGLTKGLAPFLAALQELIGKLKLPGFAAGTSSAPGGLALVGERGPELVGLPRGATVTPAAQSRDLLMSGAQIMAGQTTNANMRTTINIDARGQGAGQAAAIMGAVRAGLAAEGRLADVRIRTL